MRTPFTTDPSARMTPAARQELNAAQTQPIGTAKDATADLDRLGIAASRIEAAIKRATSTYRASTAIPDGVSDDARETVREAAETAISGVETSSRHDLAIAKARAQAIANQLEAAAATPNLNAVPPGVLDAATRLLPLVQSQLAGASLPDIAKRLKAAAVRDDPSELLAMAMTLTPILAERQADPDHPDGFVVYDLRGMLRQITERWRDRSLDAALDQARATATRLDALDRTILSNYQERTGDPDPYNFLGER